MHAAELLAANNGKPEAAQHRADWELAVIDVTWAIEHMVRTVMFKHPERTTSSITPPSEVRSTRKRQSDGGEQSLNAKVNFS